MALRSAPKSAATSSVATVEDYIAGFPAETQRALTEIRTLIKSIAPTATERISYAILRFDLDGRYLLYVAGWKKHIGVYPVGTALAEAFREELRPFKMSKSSVHFPLAEPMPLELIRRLVEWRIRELSASLPDTGKRRRRAAAAEKD